MFLQNFSHSFSAQVGRLSLPPVFKVNVTDTIFNLVTYAATISVIVFFLYVAWGAIEWITAGPDKATLERARGRITTAVIGIILIACSYAIYYIVRNITIGPERLL
ncbi:MAG: hypothetical protein KatS3mg087_0232 [Patescibacteria group bacterium]|nr:MAG: hypothetical protein KatS3mg087_0232 [Patescibacteria group bacterium]